MPREAVRKVITDKMVQKVKPAPKGKRVEYWDAVVKGFGLRVTDAGGKSFFLRTRFGTEQLRMSWKYPATTLETARGLAKDALEDIARGVDPKAKLTAEAEAKAQHDANTFHAVCERFIRQYAKPRLAASTLREYNRVLFGKDTQGLAKRPVSSITRADVRSVLDTMVERGSSGAANNTLAYLSKFFNWCAEKDLLEIPPTDRMKKPGPTRVGDRTLNEMEIKEVWQAAEAEGDLFGGLCKLLLLTGQRRGEVCGMGWSELADLDGERPTWKIPQSRTKNHRPQIVPLSSQALTIIEDRPVVAFEEDGEMKDSDLVFTTTGKTAISGFGRAKERIDQRIAQAREKNGMPPMPHWTLHDLRRTMVTMMNENLSIPPHVVEACVNHVSGVAKAGVAGVYNKALYLNERKEAMEAWGAYVEGLAAGKMVQ